jgi:hypothetical protein
VELLAATSDFAAVLAGVKLPGGSRSVFRSRVVTARPRSDQFREIESRDDNVSACIITQSRKFPELFELNDGYSTTPIICGALARASGVVMMRPI